jgi:DNA polymerase-1
MGLMGFQRAAGVSRDRAREFINRYMTEFSGVAKYMEENKAKARKDGFVSTIFGRRRYLPEINSGMPQLIAQAERMAINHPIQGTEGDFLRIAMDKIYDLIHKEYNDQDIKMLLQVHDELVFEIKDSLVDKTSKLIKNIMESVYRLDVPLTVDVKYGDNWRDMESL